METMTFDLATRHAGRMLDEHNGELWDIAAKCIQHYIFTWGDQKIREGTCTACGETMELWHEYKSVPGWVLHDPYVDTVDTSDDAFNAKIKGTTNHLDYGYCPRCGAKIQFRGLARGRQTLIEKLFLVRYGKSVIDSNTVACVGYDVRVRWGRMDDTENVLEPPIDIYPMELCVFRYGVDATRYVRERFWVMRDDNRLEKLADLRFTEKRTCTSGYFSDGQFIDYSGMRTVLDGESFDTAIADTPFARVFSHPQILDAHEFDWTDRITPMARIAKYPCIEYLLKMDMDSLARDVIDKTHLGTLNIRGKNAQKVLRFTADQWAEVKGNKLRPNRYALQMAHAMAKAKPRLNMQLCCEVGEWGQYEFEAIKNIILEFKALPMKKLLKYSIRNRVRMWDYLDHLRQMRTLEMDMTDGTMLYPKNFDQMHDRLTKRVLAKKRFKNDARIGERLEKLGAYYFSAYGMVLRPMVSVDEVLAEGNRQHHCVGTYAEQYANGGDVLCVLRDESDLFTPMYTVEFARDGHLIQCRGAHNRTRPEDEERLDRFWALYKAMQPELMKAESLPTREAEGRLATEKNAQRFEWRSRDPAERGTAAAGGA